MVARLTLSLLACAAAIAGCGGDDPEASAQPLPEVVQIGVGEGYREPPLSPAVRRAEAVGRLRCSSHEQRRYGVHVELFGNGRSAVIPAGIGVAPPHRGRPPYVRSGRCSYPLRTREPTGVLEIAAGSRLVLGDLFALWGQPLTRTRAGSFRGRVSVWLGGRAWRGAPGSVPLTRHAQIVLAVGGRVPVHARYLFPPGL